MTRAKRTKASTGETLAAVWYHPLRGVTISLDPTPPRQWSRHDASAVWRIVTRVHVVARDRWSFRIVPGQTLPKGFLWADPSKQAYGLSGPFLAYGPIERRCRDCKEMFTWSAQAQQHLYEVIGVIVDTTATRCQPCARTRRALEAARATYAGALRALDDSVTAAAHLRVAKAMLEVLRAGGRASLERAIGHCTRARKLGGGTSVDAVEQALRALRAP